MKEDAGSKNICVLKTGKLFELDIASNALADNRIPFYKQVENSGGSWLAMPFQPDRQRGAYYNIIVPEKFLEEAKQILSELPFDVTGNTDLFHFGANEKEKRGWKIYLWIILAITATILLANIAKY